MEKDNIKYKKLLDATNQQLFTKKEELQKIQNGGELLTPKKDDKMAEKATTLLNGTKEELQESLSSEEETKTFVNKTNEDKDDDATANELNDEGDDIVTDGKDKNSKPDSKLEKDNKKDDDAASETADTKVAERSSEVDSKHSKNGNKDDEAAAEESDAEDGDEGSNIDSKLLKDKTEEAGKSSKLRSKLPKVGTKGANAEESDAEDGDSVSNLDSKLTNDENKDDNKVTEVADAAEDTNQRAKDGNKDDEATAEEPDTEDDDKISKSEKKLGKEHNKDGDAASLDAEDREKEKDDDTTAADMESDTEEKEDAEGEESNKDDDNVIMDSKDRNKGPKLAKDKVIEGSDAKEEDNDGDNSAAGTRARISSNTPDSKLAEGTDKDVGSSGGKDTKPESKTSNLEAFSTDEEKGDDADKGGKENKKYEKEKEGDSDEGDNNNESGAKVGKNSIDEVSSTTGEKKGGSASIFDEVVEDSKLDIGSSSVESSTGSNNLDLESHEQNVRTEKEKERRRVIGGGETRTSEVTEVDNKSVKDQESKEDASLEMDAEHKGKSDIVSETKEQRKVSSLATKGTAVDSSVIPDSKLTVDKSQVEIDADTKEKDQSSPLAPDVTTGNKRYEKKSNVVSKEN